jgi:hypothetical protein
LRWSSVDALGHAEEERDESDWVNGHEQGNQGEQQMCEPWHECFPVVGQCLAQSGPLTQSTPVSAVRDSALEQKASGAV